MFLGIPQINKFVNVVKVSRIDDIIDRCNYYYTVLLLLFFTLLVGSKQYFGEPIICIVKQEYKDSWANYIHDYCFVMERYTLTSPAFQEDPKAEFYHGPENLKSNYQWVPFLLLAQAFSFYVPHFLWRSLQQLFSLDTEMTVEEAVKIRTLFGEDRQKAVNNLAKYIEQFLSFPKPKSCGGYSFFSMGKVVLCSTWLYILSKLLNCINIIFQLIIINNFIGNNSFFWGIELFDHLMHGFDWTKNGFFPRVVFCKYEKIEMGNVSREITQCTLTINFLNEKVFLILTLWYFLLFICTASNALITVITTLLPCFNERETRFYLLTMLPSEDEDSLVGGDCQDDKSKSLPRYLEISSNAFVTAGVKRRDMYVSKRDQLQDSSFDQTSVFDREELQMKKGYEVERSIRHFLRSVLGTDGIQLIRFMRLHGGALTARDVTRVLWEDYLVAKQSQSRFCENLQNWKPLNLNVATLKEMTTKAKGGQTLLPNFCNNYGDRQADKHPTAPCQTDSAASTSGISVYDSGLTHGIVDVASKEETLVSLSLKRSKVRKDDI